MNENSELSTNSLVEVNEYRPTAAELRLLEVLANPTFAGASVTAKCKAAGCTTPVYYAALKKPGFVEMIKDTAYDLVKSHLTDIVNATYNFAMKNPQNQQDRKMLLEMGKMLNEKFDGNVMLVKFDND